MKTLRAAGRRALTCRAPCQSISNSRSCPSRNSDCTAASRAVEIVEYPGMLEKFAARGHLLESRPRHEMIIPAIDLVRPRRTRVYETEKRMRGSRSMSALTKLVLPAPDGAAIT